MTARPNIKRQHPARLPIGATSALVAGTVSLALLTQTVPSRQWSRWAHPRVALSGLATLNAPRIR